MRVVIDRIEEEYAVVELEDRSMIDMPKLLLPEGAKEGDIVKLIICKEETKNRKKRIEKLYEDMWE